MCKEANLNKIFRDWMNLNVFMIKLRIKKRVLNFWLWGWFRKRFLQQNFVIKIVIPRFSLPTSTNCLWYSSCESSLVTCLARFKVGKHCVLFFLSHSVVTHDINYMTDNEIKNYISEKYNYFEMKFPSSHPYQTSTSCF
jgi:hypothetical protein